MEGLWSDALVVPARGSSLQTHAQAPWTPDPSPHLPAGCLLWTLQAERACSWRKLPLPHRQLSRGTHPPIPAAQGGILGAPFNTLFSMHATCSALHRTSGLHLPLRPGRQLLLPTPITALSSSLLSRLSFQPSSHREHSNAAASAVLERRSDPVPPALRPPCEAWHSPPHSRPTGSLHTPGTHPTLPLPCFPRYTPG